MEATIYEGQFDIQIIPVGEEEFHEFDFECICEPLISSNVGNLYSPKHKYVCEHRSWDDESILDMAEYSLYHTTRQEIGC